MNKIVHTSGKRKTAIARVTLRSGTGKVRINHMYLDNYTPTLYRMRIREPLMLADTIASKINLDVNVIGGGPSSQADAVRLAIGRALSEHAPELRDVFLNYDRQLLVADVRRKETHKPNRHGKARAKRQKSYR